LQSDIGVVVARHPVGVVAAAWSVSPRGASRFVRATSRGQRAPRRVSPGQRVGRAEKFMPGVNSSAHPGDTSRPVAEAPSDPRQARRSSPRPLAPGTPALAR